VSNYYFICGVSYFSFPAFSIPAFSTLCSFVPHFPVLHFHVLHFCATFSSLAFSTPCRFVPHFPVLHFHVSHFQRPHIIMSSVRPSVWLSVCNAVHCAFRGRCTGLKVVSACYKQASSYTCPFKHFCYKMYRSAHRKKRLENRKGNYGQRYRASQRKP